MFFWFQIYFIHIYVIMYVSPLFLIESVVNYRKLCYISVYNNIIITSTTLLRKVIYQENMDKIYSQTFYGASTAIGFEFNSIRIPKGPIRIPGQPCDFSNVLSNQ